MTLRERWREILVKLFKEYWENHVGLDDFGCDKCNELIDHALDLLFDALHREGEIVRVIEHEFNLTTAVEFVVGGEKKEVDFSELAQAILKKIREHSTSKRAVWRDEHANPIWQGTGDRWNGSNDHFKNHSR